MTIVIDPLKQTGLKHVKSFGQMNQNKIEPLYHAAKAYVEENGLKCSRGFQTVLFRSETYIFFFFYAVA